MYSELVDRLGLTQDTMEMLVLMGIIVVVIGVVLVLYWKYIIIGTLAIVCLSVLANHKSTINNSPVPIQKEEVIETSEPIQQGIGVTEIPKVETPPTIDVEVSKPKDEDRDIRKEFMDKCINLADYTRSHCEEIWDDRVKEERASLDANEERIKQ